MNPHQFLLENVFFTTRDMAFRPGKSITSTSRKLSRLSVDGSVTRVTQGLWAQIGHPLYSKYGVIQLLLGNEQGYISFLTALHINGVISQIPGSVQIATTGHSRRLISPIGTFEFFQLNPKMFGSGIKESNSRLTYYIATTEKALMDTLYISARKNKRFSRLPEVDLGEFDENLFKKLLREQITHKPIRVNILRKLAKLR